MGKNKSFLRELFSLLMERKVWWLAPTIILIILVSFIIVLSHGSAISPFIYALF